MATVNLTGTDVNGVFEVSAVNSVTADGGATSESILITGSGAIRASSAANLVFTSCNIFLNNVSGTAGNPNATSLSYNADSTSRLDLGRYIRFIDTNIIYLTAGSRRNIFISELTNSKVIEQDSGSQLFIYTQPNAVLDNCLIQGVNTVEVVGQFGTAFNLTIDDVMKSYLNWEAGRLDFFGLAVLNKPNDDAQADIWIGNGASDNAVWHWNNDATFNNERLYFAASNNRYYDGVTISWEFLDKDTGSPIQDVKVKVKDDFPGILGGGSMTERAEYLTNASGHLRGTWDSQNRTTVAINDTDTFFMLRNAVTRVDTNGNLTGSYSFPVALITGDQGTRGENYELDEVLNEVEVKAYVYEARAGLSLGETFDSTTQIGVLNSDGSVGEFSTLILTPDTGISVNNKTTVDAYTTLEDLDKTYDRIKAEWYDNDAYPLPTFNGIAMDLGAVDLIIDGTAVSAYNFVGGDITISTNTGNKNLNIGNNILAITTSGNVSVNNGAIIDGLTINSDVYLNSAIDLDSVVIDGDLRIATGANSTLTFTNVTVTGSVFNDSAANTLTINSSNGTSATAGDSGTGNGETDIQQTVPIKVTVKDVSTLGVIQGARVYLKAAAGGDLPVGTVIVNDLTDGNGEINHNFNFTNEQPITGRVRKGTL